MGRNTKIFLIVVVSFFSLAFIVSIINPEKPQEKSSSEIAAEKREAEYKEHYEIRHGEGSYERHLEEIEMNKTVTTSPATDTENEGSNPLPLILGIVITLGMAAFFIITGGDGDPGIHGR